FSTLRAGTNETIFRHKNARVKGDDEVFRDVISGRVQKLRSNHIRRRRQLEITRRVKLQKVQVSLLIANLKSRHDAVGLALRDGPWTCIRSMARLNRALIELVGR